MSRIIVFLLFSFIISVICEDERIVELDLGLVRGEKYWNGDFFEFYGVPYATAPKGKDRFKAPLPAEPWSALDANRRNIICPQIYLTEEDDQDVILDGVEDCLTMNILVPEIATEENPVPVMVYIHSGAFSGGSSYMAKFHTIAKHDVVTISFNYRLGAIGFACLGTEDIPGNAGLKDQVAALKWINKHIRKFGGDPEQVTLAGFSVGSSMAELLTLSKATDGLIHKLILESGSALSPFAVDIDPHHTIKNLAISIGYNDTGKLSDLNDFLLTAPLKDLATKSKNFFLKNATFGVAPCIEKEGPEAILTEHPLVTLQKGDYKQIPVLTGFANMEGISRTGKLSEWAPQMNENLKDFLPADLKFDSDDSIKSFLNNIKKSYFKSEKISVDKLQEYVDYFSDSMFKYGIIKSAKLQALKRPVYFYEFTYTGQLNFKHNYMDKLKGASHRDQSAYLLDFYDHTTKIKDLDTRDRLTAMWTDFVKYGDPTAYETLLVDVKWLPYTNEEQNYLEISHKLKMKKDVFAKRFIFWDRVYEKYHWVVSGKGKN